MSGKWRGNRKYSSINSITSGVVEIEKEISELAIGTE